MSLSHNLKSLSPRLHSRSFLLDCTPGPYLHHKSQSFLSTNLPPVAAVLRISWVDACSKPRRDESKSFRHWNPLE